MGHFPTTSHSYLQRIIIDDMYAPQRSLEGCTAEPIFLYFKYILKCNIHTYVCVCLHVSMCLCAVSTEAWRIQEMPELVLQQMVSYHLVSGDGTCVLSNNTQC